MVTCKICGLNVYDNSSLNRHMRRIHKIEPHFKCEENKTLYNFIFYVHRNKINGKCYVGATTQKSIARRWRHGKAYRFNKEFNDDIEKYGEDAFEHIELERKTCTFAEAKRTEEKYIKKYFPRYNKFVCGIKNLPTEATKAAAKKGHSIPNYYRDRIDRCRKWQHTHPDEAYAIAVKRCLAGVEVNKRPVICLETGIRYESMADAARAINTSKSRISAACSGKTQTCHGMHWIYAEKEK